MSRSNQAFVIAVAINDRMRYYCGTNKLGHIQTSWCLAGAKVFATYDAASLVHGWLLHKRKHARVQELVPVRPTHAN